MRKLLFLAAAIISISLFAKEEGSYLRDITMEYKTEHLDWCGNLSTGKIKALFIVPRKAGREVVELAQRMGMDFSSVTSISPVKLAEENIYESSVEGTTFFEKSNELLRKLDADYDIIVLGNFDFDSLPPEAQFKILNKIHDGTGLLMIWNTSTRLKKIFANHQNAEADILSMVPLQGLPETISSDKLLKTYSFGKGRIAKINYIKKRNRVLSLSAENEFSRNWNAEYENNLLLVMRTIFWAAGKEPKCKISCSELKEAPAFEYGKFSTKLNVSGEIDSLNLKTRLRNERNEIMTEKNLEVKHGTAVFDSPLLPAGKYFLDIIAENGTVVDNFGSFCFSIKSPAGNLKIDTDRESFKPGENINAVFELEKALPENATLEIRLVDSPYGRVWFKNSLEVKAGQKKVDFKLENIYIPTIAGYLECILSRAGSELCLADKILFFPNRERDIYWQIAWDAVSSSDLPSFYAKQVVDKIGWNAGLTHPSKNGENARIAALFNQRFVPYTVRIMLKNEDKTKGLRQNNWFFVNPEDRKILEKMEDQSFYNSEIQKLWIKGIENRLKNLPLYGPAVYSLGDENYFNYSETFSPSEDAEFKKFLEKKYEGKIEKLNAVWNTDYKDFAGIKISLKEAKEKGIFPAWFDIRLFWEKEYADVHHFLAQEIKKRDPQALVGAEGSVPGNLEETINGLEFWGPYSHTVMDEVLRSIGGDRMRSLWWGGYTGGSHYGRNELPIPLWKFLLTGIVNGSMWFSSNTAVSDGMLGADMRYADYFKGMLPHLNDLRNGIAQLMIKTPLKNDGIAVLFSHASDSARLLDPRFVNPNDSMTAFIEFCYYSGLNLDFLTEQMLPGKLKDYKVLFLFGASSISRKEASAIIEFVKAGGTVVADINPGLLDGFLKPASSNMLEELFGNITYSGIKAPKLLKIAAAKSVNGTALNFEAEKGLATPGLPLMQVRYLGKGKAILLNFSFASAKNTASAATPLYGFLEKLLAALQVAPYTTVKGMEDENTIIRIREGNGFKLLGILCNNNDIGKTATISIPDNSYIYEAGKGFVKKCKSWTCKFDVPFKLFAIYDKQQKAPELKLGTKSISPGAVLKLEICNLKKGEILYVGLKDDMGNVLYSKVIAVDGTEQALSIHFAYNYKPGAYSVTVKSIATGLESKANLVLK